MNAIPAEPVHLIEDAETGDRLLVYGTDKGIRVELKYDGDTLWLTQKQMSDLFGVNIPTISRHLKNIFDEGELGPDSVISKNEITAADGKTYATLHYNLARILCTGPGQTDVGRHLQYAFRSHHVPRKRGSSEHGPPHVEGR